MDRDPRSDLLTIFSAALNAVHGTAAVRRQLLRQPLGTAPVVLIAVGKAAAAMARGASTVLGSQISVGLIVTKAGHCDDELPLRCLEAGHPRPDARSLAAGDALCELLAATPTSAQLLFLISGGTSALVERLVPGADLAALGRANDWLLASGLAIDQMNAVRGALSQLKGGGLLRWVGARTVTQLLISDVPGDRPEVIGSGLLLPRSSPAVDMSVLPDWLAAHVREASAGASRDCGRAPGSGRTVVTHVVATNSAACEAAVARARQLGYPAWHHAAPLSGDAERCARDTVRMLAGAPAGVHVWGGETTVKLPTAAGRGGRNQHLALSAALAMAGRKDLWLLACGTDGSDGTTADAGGIVDGYSVSRAGDAGVDCMAALRAADAATALSASGDLVHTGPTGTNVMDLCIAIKVT